MGCEKLSDISSGSQEEAELKFATKKIRRQIVNMYRTFCGEVTFRKLASVVFFLS